MNIEGFEINYRVKTNFNLTHFLCLPDWWSQRNVAKSLDDIIDWSDVIFQGVDDELGAIDIFYSCSSDDGSNISSRVYLFFFLFVCVKEREIFFFLSGENLKTRFLPINTRICILLFFCLYSLAAVHSNSMSIVSSNKRTVKCMLFFLFVFR